MCSTTVCREQNSIFVKLSSVIMKDSRENYERLSEVPYERFAAPDEAGPRIPEIVFNYFD